MDALDTKDTLARASEQQGTLPSTLAHSERLRRAVAILTSIVALFAATGGLMSIRCNTRAMIAKNEAIMAQETATDKWAFFQSRNVRQEVAELFLESAASPKKRSELQAKVNRFKLQADKSYGDAKAIEVQRDHWNIKSVQYIETSKTFSSSLAFLQVALIFLPLTLLVNSLVLFAMGNILGVSGAVLLALGYVEYFKILAV